MVAVRADAEGYNRLQESLLINQKPENYGKIYWTNNKDCTEVP